jgi:hypothetical protein
MYELCSTTEQIVSTMTNIPLSVCYRQVASRIQGNMYFHTRDRCYDFLNIFAEKFSEKIGVFDIKQS